MGRHRLWTISDRNKMPIDVVNTLDTSDECQRCGLQNCRAIHGAQVNLADEQLLTLDELTEKMPTAANAATHLDWQNDHVMVLDIEKECPPEVANQLLRLVTGNTAEGEPLSLYSEVSMSGRGYHIILPVPDAMFTIPGVSTRTKIQHPNKWFEVLLHHWITFSREPIPQERLDQAAADPAGDNLTWEGLFTQLAHIAPGGRKVGQAMSDIQAGQALEEELTETERTLAQITLSRHRGGWNKELQQDYQGDTSRWEFAILCSLANQATALLKLKALTDAVATAQLARDSPEDSLVLPPENPVDRAQALRIMYTAALQAVPYRDKHEGTRSGLPYLLKQATVALATAMLTADEADPQDEPDLTEQAQAPVRMTAPDPIEQPHPEP